MRLAQIGLFPFLEVRELLVCMLATTAGMRPAEIFALQWRHIVGDHIQIEQRLYGREIDTPKTKRSTRIVGCSQRLQAVIEEWRHATGDSNPDTWVFPSETMRTPISNDNCWRRWIAPRLKEIGVE